MTKEERVIRYFELASTPEYLPYDTSDLREELDITEEDISDYRQHGRVRYKRCADRKKVKIYMLKQRR